MDKKEFKKSFDEDVLISVAKFEEMVRTESSIFFHSEELEDIIDYYNQKEDFNNALDASEFGISQYPYTIEFPFLKSDILITLSKYEEALVVLEGIEHLGNNHSELFIYKGDALVFLGRYNESIKNYNKALSLTEDESEVYEIYLNLAFAYQCCQDFDKALHYISYCLENNPDDAEALNELGMCMEIFEKYEECIDIFKEIIEKNPYSYLAWYYVGIGYKKLNLFEKAAEAFDYAVIIDEDFGIAYKEYGETLMELKDYKNAISLFQKEIKSKGPNSILYRKLGDSYCSIGQYQNARKYYDRALQISDYESIKKRNLVFNGENVCSRGKLHAS